MKKFIKVCVIAMFLVTLIGCSNVKFEKYCGESLNIGVIGEIPKVREDIISFQNIEFNDLEKDNELNKYDAIFITKDNLQEAAKEEYATVYNKCEVPFFFIESTKGLVPFTNEELSYEEVPDLSSPPSYAVGIFKQDKELSYVEYGLYKDIKNEKNIQGVYSQIFENISNGYDLVNSNDEI